MAITFDEAMKKIAAGVILACPECLEALNIERETQTMSCKEHGVIVIPNVKWPSCDGI